MKMTRAAKNGMIWLETPISNQFQRSHEQEIGKVNVSFADFDEVRDVAACLDGDGEAYGRLVRRYQGEIGRYMWRFSRDRAVCEELVQDVFVEAHLSLRSFKGRSPLGHWLKRIATRVGYRYWKSRSRPTSTLPVELAESMSVPAPHMHAEEAAQLLHAVLAKLPPRDRLVLTLMYLEELPVAKVAELTGWTQTMVKVQAYRAKAKLKKLLDKEART